MKNLPLIFSSLALLGVIYLIGKSVSDKKQNTKVSVVAKDSTGKDVEIPLTRIAYVDLDTLQNNYDYFVKKKAEFEGRTKKIEDELKRLEKSLQQDAASFQKKVQSGVSQAEGEKLQKSLLEKQASLEKKSNNLTSQLLKDQQKFNEDLEKKVLEIIADYNKDKTYDYVLSYTKGGALLDVNKDLDITQDIIEAINKK